MSNTLIQTARTHFEACTMTLAACGQLANPTAASYDALKAVAEKLGLKGKIDPHVGQNDHGKLFVNIAGVTGSFAVNHANGSLGPWVLNA